MSRITITIKELANNAGLDFDESLIRLWDCGLNHYKNITDIVRRRDLEQAEQALGLPTKKELVKIKYWEIRLGLDPDGFKILCSGLAINISPRATNLPKGAIAILKRYAILKPQVPAMSPDSTQDLAPVEEQMDEWKIVGHTRDISTLSMRDVELIHNELVRDFAESPDPISPPGIRDHDLLASAIYRQHTSLGPERKYPTLEMVAAALLHSLVHNHPFHNGNKRTALVSMLVLLDKNGAKVTCDEDELFEYVLRLAQHKTVKPGKKMPDREVQDIAEWIHKRSRIIEKGDRPTQWRKLKRILTSYDCVIETAPGASSRLNIERQISTRRMFLRHVETLRTQIKYTDDGREANINTIKKVRADLQLDEDHGIDSRDFYSKANITPGEFIVRYRKTLKRLAHL
jgi:death-on-curing family protein